MQWTYWKHYKWSFGFLSPEVSVMCLLKAFPNHWEISWVGSDFCSCFLFLNVQSNSKQFIFYPATWAPEAILLFAFSKQAEISDVLFVRNSTRSDSPCWSALPQRSCGSLRCWRPLLSKLCADLLRIMKTKVFTCARICCIWTCCYTRLVTVFVLHLQDSWRMFQSWTQTLQPPQHHRELQLKDRIKASVWVAVLGVMLWTQALRAPVAGWAWVSVWRLTPAISVEFGLCSCVWLDRNKEPNCTGGERGGIEFNRELNLFSRNHLDIINCRIEFK